MLSVFRKRQGSRLLAGEADLLAHVPEISYSTKHACCAAVAMIIEEQAMNLQLTAVYQKVPDGYIGFVEELPGANTQGSTLEETRANLLEAIQLVLEANRQLAEERLSREDVIREPLPVGS